MWTLTFCTVFGLFLFPFWCFFEILRRMQLMTMFRTFSSNQNKLKYERNKKSIGNFSQLFHFAVIHSQCVRSMNFMYTKKRLHGTKPPRLEMHIPHRVRNVGKVSFTYKFFVQNHRVMRCNYASSRREEREREKKTSASRIFSFLKSDKNAKCPTNLMRIKILFMVNDLLYWIIVSNGQWSFFSPSSSSSNVKYINSNLYSLYVI